MPRFTKPSPHQRHRPTQPRSLPATDFFGLLPAELLHVVVHHLRRDRLGNETIPGHVSEACGWRLLGHRFKAASVQTPSDFNGKWSLATFDGPVDGQSVTAIHGFSGGKRFTPFDRDEADNKGSYNRNKLYLVRQASTGEVKALTSRLKGALVSDQRLCEELCLQGLTQVLSGHNSSHDQRLPWFDKMRAGGKISMTAKKAEDNLYSRSVDGHYLVCDHHSDEYQPTPKFIMSLNEEDVFIGYKPFKHMNKNAIGPTITLVPTHLRKLVAWHVDVPIQLTDGNPGERVNVVRTAKDEANGGLSPLSVVLGYYDTPRVAECKSHKGKWLSALNHHPNHAESMDKPTRTDPERGIHHRADMAQCSASTEAFAAKMNAAGAIVVHRNHEEAYDHDRRVAAFKRGGPLATTVANPRSSAMAARKRMKPQIKAENLTFNSGRLFAHTQPAESREAEDNGEVDDQYASALAEGESDGEHTDDEDYKAKTTFKPAPAPAPAPPATKPKSKPKSKPAPAPASKKSTETAVRLRNLVVLSSDDEDEEPEPAVSSFKSRATRMINDLFDM